MTISRIASDVQLERPLKPAPVASGWLLVSICSALATLIMATGPMSETDVFWHIRVGQQLIDHRHFPSTDPWAFTLPNAHWRPTAWLTEVLFYLLYKLAGANGINAVRLVLVAALCLALARQLLPRRTRWIGAAVFSLTVLPLSAFDQERPQLISFLFLVWLASVCRELFRDSSPPRPLVFGIATWLWANFHGYWVLAPTALALATVCLWLSDAATPRLLIRRSMTAAVAGAVGAALTPIGPTLLLTPFTVSGAGRGVIGEWLPTRLTMPYAIGIDLMVLACAVCWARSTTKQPRGEILWAATWLGFALVASRNIAPAMLLLAPWVADTLEATYGDKRPGPLLRRSFVWLVAIAGVFTIGASQFFAPSIDPSKPVAIANRLAGQTRPVKVLNDYNVSGYLILRGGNHIRLAIDGRADRYGNQFIKRYADAESGIGWRSLIRELRPDVAVLSAKSQLSDDLQSVGHWRLMERDGQWLLLARPGFALK